jgi:hypothetical protein
VLLSVSVTVFWLISALPCDCGIGKTRTVSYQVRIMLRS